MNHFIKYSEYNYWANELLLNLIKNDVNSELPDKEIVSSFSSLRKTVYHLWDAEYIWLRRLTGQSLDNWPSKNYSGTFANAADDILKNDTSFINYVKSLNDERLSEMFTYKNVEGKPFTNPVWESVHHCMNHSTYHRGQIVTMLRQLGIENIPSTDFITYCRLQNK